MTGRKSSLRLYRDTVMHLKPSQIAWRLARKAGVPRGIKLGYRPRVACEKADLSKIALLPELDFDAEFLDRFNCDDIMNDEITLLNHSETLDWRTCWHEPLSTHLWRFNLQYCEFLLSLVAAWRDSGDLAYLDKAKSIVSSWVLACPESAGGDAWHPYTISLRLANWIAFWGESEQALRTDPEFIDMLVRSVAEQYVHLSRNLEKDLLANHYFENLKALILGALLFGDEATLNMVLPLFEGQCVEQVLPDGMHFELSCMYHKIVLEDLLRVTASLKRSNIDTNALEQAIDKMCSCLYSLEKETGRTPLFNDAGNNVAKGKDALLRCARKRFGIEPVYRSDFPDAGYYLMESRHDGRVVKVIFDAGAPGPSYAAGHSHCDALSFECFVDGVPVVMNAGTFAYQDDLRGYYRGTSAHNTVMVDGEEQSQCWGEHRLARYSSASFLSRRRDRHAESLKARMTDWNGGCVERTLELNKNKLTVRDASSRPLDSFLHLSDAGMICGDSGSLSLETTYAPEFGCQQSVYCFQTHSDSGKIELTISLFDDNAGDMVKGES